MRNGTFAIRCMYVLLNLVLPIFLSIFTNIDRTPIAAYVLWTGLSIVRTYNCDPTAWQDGLIFALTNAWFWREPLCSWIISRRFHIEAITLHASPFLAFSIVISLSVPIILAFSWKTVQFFSFVHATKTAGEIDVVHRKPLIFPCRTTHARVFPKRHAFDYSYLLVGIPITKSTESAASSKPGICASDFKWGKGWLQIRAEDYLERGRGQLGLYGKLKRTLNAEDMKDSEWDHAYLVTAPRFFGYSFNPVSFWYIYDQDDNLTSMILEVNNTFDERRIYLLRAPPSHQPSSDEDAEHKSNQTRPRSFTNVWRKDFHVSPFNSRKGSYTLKALDPFGSATPAKIDNTITLKSSKDHAKLVARIFSTDRPLEPQAMSGWETVQFIAGWWWVGLVTFPRILREAVKLFFKRRLHVWFRPEVMFSSMARNATSTEIALESFLERYLKSLVDKASGPLQLTYRSPTSSGTPLEFKTSHSPGLNVTGKHLEIRVLTPAFYSRFVHYSHTSEAFDRECLCTDEKNRTLWVSNPELLAILLPKSSKADPPPLRTFDSLRWAFLRKLRCAPSDPAYPLTPKGADWDVRDIRQMPSSDLDRFVQVSCRDSWVYRRKVIQLFLAQRLAFGFSEIIAVIDIVLRILLVYFSQEAFVHMASRAQLDGGTFWDRLPGALAMALASCIPHCYACLKGFRRIDL